MPGYTKLLMFCVATMLACTQNKFSGPSEARNANPETSGDPLVDRTPDGSPLLALNCQKTLTSTVRVGPGKDSDLVLDNTTASFKIRGQFCPSLEEAVTVLIIQDFSRSMETNDPIVSGSCGRLRAVETIVEKMNKLTQASIGVVSFGGDVVSEQSYAPMSLANFKAQKLKATEKLENFCRQDISGTNYVAALEEAYTYLKPVTGRKLVYFITDGEPTMPERDPIDTAIEAAQELKSLENLSLNGFYLNSDPSSQHAEGWDNLVATVGSEDNVKEVDSADQLAKEVAQDNALTFENAQLSAILKTAQGESRKISIESFGPDPKDPKRWVFITGPIPYQKPTKDGVKHELTIKAQAKDGSAHVSKITIQPTR